MNIYNGGKLSNINTNGFFGVMKNIWELMLSGNFYLDYLYDKYRKKVFSVYDFYHIDGF